MINFVENNVEKVIILLIIHGYRDETEVNKISESKLIYNLSFFLNTVQSSELKV